MKTKKDFMANLPKCYDYMGLIAQYFNISRIHVSDLRCFNPQNENDIQALINYQLENVLYIDEAYLKGLNIQIGEKYIVLLDNTNSMLYITKGSDYLESVPQLLNDFFKDTKCTNETV